MVENAPSFDEDDVGIGSPEHAVSLEGEDRIYGDPRDYFKKTVFGKIGREIDPESSHPWEDIYTDSLLVKNEFGTIICGETLKFNSEKDGYEGGLLIAARSNEGWANSVHVRDLSLNQSAVIAETLNNFTPVISGENRVAYASQVIEGLKKIDNSYPEELMALQLSEFSLSQLPDQLKETVEPSREMDWGEKPPTTEQTEQLSQLLRLVSSKMNSENFNRKVEELSEDLRLQYLNDPFGSNYAHFVTKIASWPVEFGSTLERDYDSLRREEPKAFSVVDQIKQPISSPEQLGDILRNLPAEDLPLEADELSRMAMSSARPEFVDLDLLVGGRLENNSWTVSTAYGRGLDNVYGLAQTFQSSNGEAFRDANPISVLEYQGKYYIESDGRHRSAALKALGVSKYPMMVTHLSEKPRQDA